MEYIINDIFCKAIIILWSLPSLSFEVQLHMGTPGCLLLVLLDLLRHAHHAIRTLKDIERFGMLSC
uniref:Uncharacterized protein n=1 Tax=Ulva partita TaxID=1605170 RepID=A0A1C9ZRS9_9CHLO|nr:hypothetical protein [Ulva partita]